MTKLKKNTSKMIEALKLGLNAMKNANNHFQEHWDQSYLLTIQSQLRGLVAIGGKSMHPLLINLSKELHIELEFYALTGSDDQKKSSSTVIGKTWSPIPRDGFQKYLLEDWLMVNDFFAFGSMQFKNRNQIIKDTSNFEGGTHYLEETPHIVDSLKKERVGRLDNLSRTLLDISELVFYLGHLLIIDYECNVIKSLKIITKEEQDKKLKDLEYRKQKHIEFFSEMGSFNFIAEGFVE